MEDGSWLAYTVAVLVAVGTIGVVYFRAIRPALDSFRPASVNPFVEKDAHYDEPADEPAVVDAQPVHPFERPEPPLFVPPVHLPNEVSLGELDLARLDTLARLLAAGAVSESAAITAVWDGRGGVLHVSKGGSKAYTDRRDVLRALAAHYGWQSIKPAAQPAPSLTPLVGRPVPAGVQFPDDE